MDEAEVIEILHEAICLPESDGALCGFLRRRFNALAESPDDYVEYKADYYKDNHRGLIKMDGHFSLIELEALVWWMKNK